MDDPAAPMTAAPVSKTPPHRTPGAAQLTVVAHGDELQVKEPAVVPPHPPHADRVPAADVPVQPGLRPVRLVKHLDGGLRRRRAPQLLGLALERPHHLGALLRRRRGPPREPQRHTRRVPVQHGHARAARRDAQVPLLLEARPLSVDVAEDLARLVLQLVLLALDVRHDVVEDVHGADAGVTRARHGLEGDDGGALDGAEGLLEGGEGDGDANDGAVGVADEEALLGAHGLALVGDQVHVREVDGRNDEGDNGVLAVVARVGEDGEVGLLELGF